MIIDDEPAVAQALAEAIEGQGHTSLVAHSGHEGLAAIEAQSPDAVFLDMAMPGLDGIAVLREIRRVHPSVPVIIISGWATTEQIAEARRFGITDVIDKPLVLKYMETALKAIGSGPVAANPRRN
jgi:DNA-binding response OmpR family regulator